MNWIWNLFFTPTETPPPKIPNTEENAEFHSHEGGFSIHVTAGGHYSHRCVPGYRFGLRRCQPGDDYFLYFFEIVEDKKVNFLDGTLHFYDGVVFLRNRADHTWIKACLPKRIKGCTVLPLFGGKCVDDNFDQAIINFGGVVSVCDDVKE